MKHKRVSMFKKSILGYKKSHVEKHITTQAEYYDQLLAEQKTRIDEMRDELTKKENQLTIYKCKEDDIKKALVSATEKAEEIETDLKLQYAMEIERLKIFQAKWTNAYDELKEKYHFDKDSFTMEALVTDTALQLERLLNKDFGIPLSTVRSAPEQQFKSESDRLQIDDTELKTLITSLKSALR